MRLSHCAHYIDNKTGKTPVLSSYRCENKFLSIFIKDLNHFSILENFECRERLLQHNEIYVAEF